MHLYIIILSLLFFSCGNMMGKNNFEQDVSFLLSKMSLDEKIGQMTQIDPRYIENEGDVKKYFIGSLLSGGGSHPPENNPNAWVDMYNKYQSEALGTRLGIPMIYGIDAVHGHNNLYGSTIFPHNIGLGCANDFDLVKKIGQVTAKEVYETGLDWTFSPCLAVSQDERWGRTYESFSEDTKIVDNLGLALVQGLQGKSLSSKNTVLACAKHYVGDGTTIYGTGMGGGTDRGNVLVSEKELREKYIKPFKTSVDEGVGSIMISYNSWKSKRLHGHKYLITDVLKNELGFSGFVVSDWSAIDDVDKNYKIAIIKSINAGIDMVMVPGRHNPNANSYTDFINLLKESVKEGSVKMSRINDAVSRILNIKYSLGLFSNPLKNKSDNKFMSAPSSRKIARESVQKSLVLLKNDLEVLPIKKDIKTIAVVGSMANDIGAQCGGWSISWQGGLGETTPGSTILEGIREMAYPNQRVLFSKNGDNIVDSDVVVVVVGESPYSEWYGDRDDLSLSKKHQKLLNKINILNKPTVVILLSGRPMIIEPFINEVSSFIAAWLPGTEGGGIADILFNQVKPSGKLSMSWPKSMDQIPINIGDEKYNPLFSFGFGLTY